MRYIIICGVIALAVCSKINDLVYTAIMATTGDYEKAHEISSYGMLASFVLIAYMALLWYFYQGHQKRSPTLHIPPPTFRRPRMYGEPENDEIHIPVPEEQFPCTCRYRTKIIANAGTRWKCENPECQALHITSC